MDPFALVIVAIFLVVFTLFWSGVVWLIAALGGWRRLAGLFGTDRPPNPDAQTFQMVSGRLGTSQYSGVLRVDVQADGLRLAVFPFFRPGHPPLLIPWGEIVSVERRQVLFLSAFVLTIGDPRVATLQLPERVIEAMRDALPTAVETDEARER